MSETLLELGIALIGSFVTFLVMDAIFDRIISRKIIQAIKEKRFKKPHKPSEEELMGKLYSQAHYHLESLYGPEDRVLEAHALFMQQEEKTRTAEQFMELIERRQDETFNAGLSKNFSRYQCAVCAAHVTVSRETIFTGGTGNHTVYLDKRQLRDEQRCTCARGHYRQVMRDYGDFVRPRYQKIKEAAQ